MGSAGGCSADRKIPPKFEMAWAEIQGDAE